MKTKLHTALSLLLLGLGPVSAAAAQAPGEPHASERTDVRARAKGVTAQRLLAAAREPENWLSYSGGYAGWQYSPLGQIDTSNVGELTLRWVFQAPYTHVPEASRAPRMVSTPVVVDGVLYLTGWNNTRYALDARTGRPLWSNARRLPREMPFDKACCGRVNRGVAVSGDRLFVGTLDAHVLAVDAKTGQVVWDVTAEDYRAGYNFTGAPLVVKDKVLVGVAGGDYGTRGFIDAYEVDSGRRAWRFYTVPGPGQAGNETWTGDSWSRGGGPAWLTGSYDPELDLVYWGIGNPAPDLHGGERRGDNLYTNSMVALDPDTGELAWHFQFTPHDLHDWDGVQVPVLADLSFEGKLRKVLLQANRNGFFYALDRRSGAFLFARPFVHVTWAKEIGKDGRPVLLPGNEPTPDGSYVCPSLVGGVSIGSPSYNPVTGLFYVAASEACEIFHSVLSPSHRRGKAYMGGMHRPRPGDRPWGALRALDPRTGSLRWEFRYHSPPAAGVLSTVGGLVFTGDVEGYLMAFDAWSGKLLWRAQTGAPIRANPIAFAVDGKQHVAVASGTALFVFALPDRLAPRHPGSRTMR